MLNCIRFGMVAGKERMLVSGQDGYVRIFEVPREAIKQSQKGQSEDIRCFREAVCKLLRPGTNPNMQFIKARENVSYTRRVVMSGRALALRTAALAAGQSEMQAELHDATVALGPMPVAVNCADASPDGRWIAVASDSLNVLLLPEALDYCHMAALKLEALTAGRALREPGCQYVAWSPDSRYLAVSSDSDKTITVWRIETPDADAMKPAAINRDLRHSLTQTPSMFGTSTVAVLSGAKGGWPRDWGTRDPHARDNESGLLPFPCEERNALQRICAWRVMSRTFWKRVRVTRVAAFDGHAEACLALRWHPTLPSVLFYTQFDSWLSAVDVRNPYRARQDVDLAAVVPQDTTRRRRANLRAQPADLEIMGLCVAPSANHEGHSVVVALEDKLVYLPVVTAWNPSVHRLWPLKYKKIVVLLLLNEKFGSRQHDAEHLARSAEGPRELMLCDMPRGIVDLVLAWAADAQQWC